MNAVDAFSAQMRQMGYSTAGGPTPTPPTWPGGAPAVPNVPPPVAPTQTGQSQQQGHWYALPAGNPERLTVAQVIQKAYKLDPQRDANQINEIATYVAQQNGILLANWPIPNHVTGLRLPWAPSASGEKKEKKEKKSINFGQVIAGIGAVAAGAARIVGRHSGQGNALPPGTYGYPNQPNSGNRDVDMISADIGDAVPIIAQIGAIFSGQPVPGATPPGYYGQTYAPNAPYNPYAPPPVYQPPVYQPPVYQPPVYQPPVYQPPQRYSPPIYQPPVYQQPQPYTPPSYQTWQPPTTYSPGTYAPNGGTDAWGNQMNQIVNSVGQLANTIGQVFGKKR